MSRILLIVTATLATLLVALPARAEMDRKDAGPGTAPGATAPGTGTGSGAPGIPPKESGSDMQPGTLKPRSGTDTGTGPTGSGTGGGGAGNPPMPMPEAGAGSGGGPGR